MIGEVQICGEPETLTEIAEYLRSAHPELLVEPAALGVRFRGIEPTILIAAVGAAGAGLSALIGGILGVAKMRHSQRIVIQGASGRRLEMPVDITPEQLAQYIQVARDLDAKRIEV